MLLGDMQQLQVRAEVDEINAPLVTPHRPAVAYPKGSTAQPIPLTFVRIEPYIVPKKSLTGENTERDTRVLQIIYRFERPTFPVYRTAGRRVYRARPHRTRPSRGVTTMKQASALWQQAGSLIAGLLTLSVAGCLGQSYTRLPVSTPTDWTAAGSGSCDRRRLRAAPSADWWQAFRNENSPTIERALAQNHDVRRVASRVIEGRAAMTTAGAGLYPQLNVQGSYTNISISKNTLAGVGSGHGQQPAAGLRQARQ